MTFSLHSASQESFTTVHLVDLYLKGKRKEASALIVRNELYRYNRAYDAVTKAWARSMSCRQDR